jgi:hypothetical protein
MSVMLDDVARHELAMNGLVTRMGDMMVHPCSDEGTHHMSQELTDTNAEVAQHSKQMRAAGTLGAGHFECTVHAHELGERLESMRNALGSMSCAR